jgi:magnesium-transporting ATPase (P-type)
LHRGSFLKNSTFVVALVVFTGINSKLVMNLGKYRHKKSRLEVLLNFVILCNLIVALALGVLGAILNHFWVSTHFQQADYIFFKSTPSPSISVKAFFSFFLILNSFVPLDLLVILEISKLWYTPFMEWDATMVEPDYQTK